MGCEAGVVCVVRPGQTGFAMREMTKRRPAAFIVLLALLATPASARALPPGLVYLREVAPAIAQEMRYASYDNFTGRPLPGYEAPECILRREAAQALAKVQADLEREHLGLKVYDCYRPTRAVRAFWRWSQTGKGGQKRFYPNVPKAQLFARGFIATHSRHSTGTAVDLTLIALPAPQVARFDRAAQYGPCTAPLKERAPDNSLDMGTGFDCLDVKSYTRSRAISAQQRQARESLRAAMSRHGFRNYFREWWHYEFGDAPRRYYDIPITSSYAPR
jgi:D-alanyl-D-alanine dipeptidase